MDSPLHNTIKTQRISFLHPYLQHRYNHINGGLYHYGEPRPATASRHNPVKYTDPTGEAIALIPFVTPAIIAGVKVIGAWLGSLLVVGAAATAVGVTIDVAIENDKENDSSPENTNGIVPNNPDSSKEIGNHDIKEHKKTKSGSGREKSDDIPSWAEGRAPYIDESGKEFAKRLMDEKYGEDNYEKGPNSEFNKLKKWGDRGFE